MALVREKEEPVTSKIGLGLTQRLGRVSHRWWSGPGLQRGLSMFGLILILWAGYVFTGQPVTLVVNDQPHQIRAHRLTVAAVLREIGLTLEAEDIIHPPPNATLSPGDTITIRLARPVRVEVDGRTSQLLTHQQTVAAVLDEAGIIVNPRDEILINEVQVSPPSSLRPPTPASPSTQNVARWLLAANPSRRSIDSARPEVVRLTVHRAVPVTLNDGQVRSTFYTTQPNVGEALLAQGITLFEGDQVTPSLDTQLLPGMRIYLQRSVPVTVAVDGRTIQTRTLRQTVGEVLAQETIALMGQDFSRPPADHLITANDRIEIVRVRETIEIEQEFVPIEAKWVPDPEMEIDNQEVRQAGTVGLIKKRTRVRHENGQVVERKLEDEWLDQEPTNRVIAYGTKIVVRTLETEDGPIEYWRKIPMLATAYSAATSGKDPDHPRYGITRSGLPARYGIVAVDPKVIPLMTDLYVPGYGPALAADTGGLVLGKHIDLGYDEDQPLPDLYQWRDVYVLTPVPPPDKIRYVLPNWPQRQ
jgi:uncharacterized protein YabE (DUF348 family)